MKGSLLELFLLYCLMGCAEEKLTKQQHVITDFKARDAGDYQELKTVVDDSITIVSGDYIMPYNHDGFYEQFKWDSVFKPSYEIVALEEKNSHIIAAVTLNSIRNTFLKNSGMTCRYKISFNSEKISKIEELECEGVDWSVWQKERDSLVEWVNKNHPELAGFLTDMTMNGSQKYLKAIVLYEKAKTTL